MYTVQPLSSTQYHLSRTDGTGFQAAMCRNSADISSTLLPGIVSNADLIISKRAFRVYRLHSKKSVRPLQRVFNRSVLLTGVLLSGDYCNT